MMAKSESQPSNPNLSGGGEMGGWARVRNFTPLLLFFSHDNSEALKIVPLAICIIQ